MSQSRLSTRISIRWPPEPAFENTDTLVLSVSDWYVDLRVDRASGTIDWAIAGQRLTETGDLKKVLFTHELDSHNSFNVADCGTFSTLPNGDELETGSMPRADLPDSPVSEYEEVWRKLLFRRGIEGRSRGVSWVLEAGGGGDVQLEEGGECEVLRTFAAAIWGTFVVLQQKQVLVRPAGEEKVVVKRGGDVSAMREEYKVGEGYAVKYLLGPMGDSLPRMADFQVPLLSLPGSKVVVSGVEYVVRAFEDIGGDAEWCLTLSTDEPIGA